MDSEVDMSLRSLPDPPAANKTKGKLLWESFKRKFASLGLLHHRKSVRLRNRGSVRQRHSVYWDDHKYSGSIPYGLYYHILDTESHVDSLSAPIDQDYEFVRPDRDRSNQPSAHYQPSIRRHGSINQNQIRPVFPLITMPIQEDYAAPVADCQNSPSSMQIANNTNNCENLSNVVAQQVSQNLAQIKPLNEVLFNLYKQGWYWGPISRMESEIKLQGLPTGSFLVRDSSDDRHLLSLSFRFDDVTLHCRIEYSNGLFSLLSHGRDGCPTVEEFIEKSVENAKKGEYCLLSLKALGVNSRMIPVKLSTPVSRFTEVKSLQYLCRFVIRQYIRVDGIDTLPIPENLKNWIAEQQY